MLELHEDLAQIIYKNIRNVEMHQEHRPLRTLVGEVHIQTTLIERNPLEVTCIIPMYGIHGMNNNHEDTFRIFHDWISSRRKFDVGRYKGMVPIEIEMAYRPSSYDQEIRVKLLCDYIEDHGNIHAPAGTIEPDHASLMMKPRGITTAEDPLGQRTPAPVPAKKPENKEHFDEDLFDI